MTNTNKLKGLIVSKGFSQRSFAKLINMNKDTFNNKLNNKSEFKTGEILKICEVLQIVEKSEKVDIFLSE
jgi:transcriptional regulator with XRE-family HTH domain